jgi:UDP-N-acetylmuramyl pentapeptide phosphotransferase/UDP-N-acetylglucosamine-1-phosphate transferase
MIDFIIIPTILIIIIFLNYFCTKRKILLSFSGEKHQKFVTKEKIPLIGGIIFLLSISFLDLNLEFKLMSLLIFLLGIFSDLKIISSPNLRFYAQLLVVILSVNILNIEINNTRVIFLDNYLDNFFFNILFSSFCIIIIINGTNFIDGVNLNTIVYYLIVNIILYFLSFDYYILLSEENILTLFFIILIIVYANYKNKLFLGDNGSYIFAFFYSVILINFYFYNQNISPFYIILLLWYPSFEILFSILRKFLSKKSPFKPDNLHLHHLLFNFIKKYNFFSKRNKNIPGIVINFYNLIIFWIGSHYISHSQSQILLILISIIIYILVYFKLLNRLQFQKY